ncbi:MAG: NnrU family protein, partial [Rhizomicrobium sp.]
MSMLIAAAVVFLAIHLLIAGTPLRDAITGAIGEGPYLGLFSLASLGAIVWLALAFGAAHASADNRVLFNLGRGAQDLAIPVVLIAFLIGVPGLMMPNP